MLPLTVEFKDYPTSKLKFLILEPGQVIAYQRHKKRNEFWFVTSGSGEVMLLPALQETDEPLSPVIITLSQHDKLTIPQGSWHMLTNTGQTELHIIEIQYGEHCSDNDVETWPPREVFRTEDLPDDIIDLLTNTQYIEET